MAVLRTGILGCGSFGHVHARNLVALPDQFAMVAFCSRTAEKAASYAAQYGAPGAKVYTDHQAMFADSSLDLVVINLPPYAHTDEVEVAARHGTHIFIEKPIALTSDLAWRMVEACEQAGIKTQVGFQLRFGGAVEALKTRIASGAAGKPGLMSARYFCNSLHSDWWRQRDLSGGQLVEQVIHMVDLMRYLMGEPATVFSIQNNLYHQDVPGYTVEDISGTLIGFQTGSIGVIYASNNAVPGKWTNDYRLVTGKITAEFSDANHAVITLTDSQPPQSETLAFEHDMYRLELLDLWQAIDTGGQTRTPMREGALSLDLALASVQSANTGQPVQF